MQFAQFTSMTSKQRVDRAAGIIFGVSVITKGEAKTHGIWIDDRTLDGILSFAAQSPDGVRVKLAHTNGKESPVFSIVGNLKNFRKEEPSVRADFHLLHSDDNFGKILEMSEKQPKDFGLSISSDPQDFTTEEIDGKDFLRINRLGSVDLVSDPAANDNGLFSKKEPINMSKSIKYAKGDSGDHAHDCECKMCMSKKDDGKDGKMSAIFASLGLTEDANPEDFILALGKKLKPADMDAVMLARLEKLEKQDAQTLALSQKQQIDNLLADASREGKTVPFELSELYGVKDGVITIHESPVKLQKVIAKLAPNQVMLGKNRPKLEPPKGGDGKPIQIFGLNKRRNPDQLALTQQFCAARREENAVVIGQHIKRQHTESLGTQMN